MQQTSKMNLKSTTEWSFYYKLKIKKIFPVFTCSLGQQNNVIDTCFLVPES